MNIRDLCFGAILGAAIFSVGGRYTAPNLVQAQDAIPQSRNPVVAAHWFADDKWAVYSESFGQQSCLDSVTIWV